MSEQADLSEMFKMPPKVSVRQPLWQLLIPFFPTPSTSSAMNIPENTEEDPHDPEPADEGYIEMEHSSD